MSYILPLPMRNLAPLGQTPPRVFRSVVVEQKYSQSHKARDRYFHLTHRLFKIVFRYRQMPVKVFVGRNDVDLLQENS